MTTFTDVFSGNPITPSLIGYRAISLTASITMVWAQDAPADANVVAQIMDVTPDAGGYTVTMPDARLVSTGTALLFYNPSAFSFTVAAADATSLATVTAGDAVYLYLRTNSTEAGTWRTVTFGAGTSVPDAASLAGNGVQALNTTLNLANVVETKNANYTLVANDRASTVVSTGGAITFDFTAASVLTDGWVVLVRNQGSGTLTLDPDAAETIDGASTKALAVGESCFVICDGSNFYTVGYGRSITNTVTAVNINLAGSGTYTESSSEVASQIQNYTGLLTGARTILMGTSAGYWMVYNNTTGAFATTIKTNLVDTGATVAQGSYSIIRSDGTSATVAFSSTSGTVTSVATGTGLTGGPITSTGTISLANTAVVAGSYGSATKAMTGTVDAQGRLTAASETTVTPAFSSITGTPTTIAGYGITDAVSTSRTLTAGTGLSGGGDLSANRSFAITATGVAAATYTNATVTFNAQGQATSASSGTAPVTSVSGTAPITSSGGTTPTITHDKSGVTAAAYANPSSVTVDDKGHVTAITAGTRPQIVAQCTFNGLTGALIGTAYNVSSITGGGTASFQVNFTSALASTEYHTATSVFRSAGNSQTQINLIAVATTSVTLSCTANNSGDSTVFGANSTRISVTVWL